MILRKKSLMSLSFFAASFFSAVIIFVLSISESLAQSDDLNSTDLLSAANIAFEAKDFEAAAIQYAVLYKRFPEDSSIANNYSVSLFQAGHHADAAAVIQEFLSGHGEVGEITGNLFTIYDYIASESYALLNGVDAELPELGLSDSVPNIPVNDKLSDSAITGSTDTIASTQNNLSITTTKSQPSASQSSNSSSATQNTVPRVQGEIALPINSSSSVSEQEADLIEKRLNDYINAWREGNVDRYLSFYYPSISPVTGVSYNDWVQSRVERIFPEREIELSVEDLRVHFESDQDVVMEYIQRYRSKNYRDRTLKQMRWRKYQGFWYIRNEKSLPR